MSNLVGALLRTGADMPMLELRTAPGLWRERSMASEATTRPFADPRASSKSVSTRGTYIILCCGGASLIGKDLGAASADAAEARSPPPPAPHK